MNENAVVDYLCAAWLVQCVELQNDSLAQARSIDAAAGALADSYDIAIPEALHPLLLTRLAADGVVEPVEDAYAKGFFLTSEQALRDAWQRLYLRKGSVAANTRQLGNAWLKAVFRNPDFSAALASAAAGQAAVATGVAPAVEAATARVEQPEPVEAAPEAVDAPTDTSADDAPGTAAEVEAASDGDDS